MLPRKMIQITDIQRELLPVDHQLNAITTSKTVDEAWASTGQTR